MTDSPSSSTGDSHRPGLSAAAVGFVAAIYIHFLIFAQFGFLQGIQAAGLSTAVIHRVLGAMAVAGIGASLATALMIRGHEARHFGSAGLALAAAAGGIAARTFSSGSPTALVLLVIALLTGAGLGAATVSAAVLLRIFTGGHRLGLHVGLGTGAAYLVCNVPAVFEAAPAFKAGISTAAAALGAVLALIGRTAQVPTHDSGYAHLTSRQAVSLATLGFAALVWFDSAAFTALQNSATLRLEFWSGAPALWTIGATHTIAALISGVLLDRGRLRICLGAAMALLVAGHLGFTYGGGAWAAPAYVAGVSLYSAALAAFGALAPASVGMHPASRAAWVYAFAGWVASGAGVGLAEQLGHVPVWAAPAAALVLMVCVVQLRNRA